MATNFPTSLDSFTNPSSSSTLDSPSHAAQHANINDAVEAVQAKLGTGAGTIGTYTDYSSSVTFSGFTKGTSTVVAKYTKINKFVHYWGYVITQSGFSMTGPLDVSLPATATGGILTTNSACSFYDGATLFWGTALNVSTGSIRLVAHNATGSYAYNTDLSATVPFTWATGDAFYWNHYYEAA